MTRLLPAHSWQTERIKKVSFRPVTTNGTAQSFLASRLMVQGLGSELKTAMLLDKNQGYSIL